MYHPLSTVQTIELHIFLVQTPTFYISDLLHRNPESFSIVLPSKNRNSNLQRLRSHDGVPCCWTSAFLYLSLVFNEVRRTHGGSGSSTTIFPLATFLLSLLRFFLFFSLFLFIPLSLSLIHISLASPFRSTRLTTPLTDASLSLSVSSSKRGEFLRNCIVTWSSSFDSNADGKRPLRGRRVDHLRTTSSY